MPPSPKHGFGWFDGEDVGEPVAAGGVGELAAPGSDSVADPHPPRASAVASIPDTASNVDDTSSGRFLTR
jgi:hypothetical protein